MSEGLQGCGFHEEHGFGVEAAVGEGQGEPKEDPEHEDGSGDDALSYKSEAPVLHLYLSAAVALELLGDS